MAELTISADDIEGAIASYVSSFEAGTGREEIGTVIDAGDGIAHVEGLPSAMTQELLEFPGGVLGVALNLDEHSIGAVILGDFEKIEQGQQVKRTGEVLSVPVGDAFMGRVVNPLGQPIELEQAPCPDELTGLNRDLVIAIVRGEAPAHASSR